jgi:hypothetical protein
MIEKSWLQVMICQQETKTFQTQATRINTPDNRSQPW